MRSQFPRWPAIVFLLLLPSVIYSAWGYVEARRLAGAIDEIAKRGEPISRPSGPMTLSPEAAEAVRDYRAAGALASDFWRELSVGAGPTALGLRVEKAEREGVWSDDLVNEIRAAVADRQEALALADRASALPFDGFRAGFSYQYLTSELFGVSRLTGLRAVLEAIDRKGDAAADSLYTGVRLMRPMENSFVPTFWLSSRLEFVLGHTRPSAERLSRLQQALQELDRDDWLTRQFQAQRAFVLDQTGAGGRLGGWFQF